MVAAVAHLAESHIEPQEPTPDRGEVVARYRHLRAVSKRHKSAAMRLVARDAVLQQARRLGLAQGKTFILDTLDELALAFDLAVYTAPAGRSRAIDRYARATRFAADSDEALVLDAMCQARFSVLSVTRRHPSAGLIVTDVARESELWLMDEGLEATLPERATFAARYYAPDRFVMTAGVVVPVDITMIAGVAGLTSHLGRKPLAEMIEDRRFAEAIYRTAVADGTTQRMAYQDLPGTGASG
jgi:hypothetical protein